MPKKIQTLSLALAGAGLVGKWHAAACEAVGSVELRWVVDPSEAGRSFAESSGLDWYPSLPSLFAEERPDGVIIATPNQVHLENGLDCIEAACPALIEKPIAPTTSEAARLVRAAMTKGVTLLVGHHRRHNPLVRQAKSIIDEGRLGRIVTVQGSCWLLKPDDYFAQDWRKRSGGGPVLVNAIHDLDLLRHLCGEILAVQAQVSSNLRAGDNEDSAVVLLSFRSGAIGSFSVSDCVAAPWSWELTAAENPAYPATTESCYLIGGTKASLSIPDNRLWSHGPGGHWKTAIQASAFPGSRGDPLVAQVAHFAAVIRGEELPLVTGVEATRSLAVVEAILMSAKTGHQEAVLVPEFPLDQANTLRSAE